MKISNELTLITKNDISTGELSKDQINKLLDLMTSWTELLQKEINLIEDIKVWIVRSSSRVPFFNTQYTINKSKRIKISILNIIS